MYYLLFKIFQFFGVFPFKIENNKIKVSKLLFKWSILITSSLLLISIHRCIFFNALSTKKYNYIFTILVKYEPFWVLTGIFLSSIPTYFFQSRLKKYIQSFFNLSLALNGKNKRMIAVLIIIIFQWCVYIAMMHVIFFPTMKSMEAKYEAIVATIQLIFRTLHLLHFYVGLNTMVENVKLIERSMENGHLIHVFDEFCKVMKVYGQLRKLYQISMRFILLEVFYDAITGVKRLDDYLFYHYGVQHDGDREAVIVYWCMFHVPLLILVLHEGHLFHQKVFYFE